MRLIGKYILSPIILSLSLGASVHAQNFAAAKSGNEEARGLLKRLENYEDKYLATKESPKDNQSNVMAKQQEVLVSEVLRLRSQISQLEAQIAQGQEAVDFSQEEQKLITELTKERKRADDLEKQLAEEKSKDFSRLNRELEDAKTAIVTERQSVAKKEKLLKEVSEKVSQLEAKLDSQQEIKKSFTKLKNESEQLELQLEARRSLEADNSYLKKSLDEEKQKSSDLIKKSKDLIQRISLMDQEIKSKKTSADAELESKINEYEKEIIVLKKKNKNVELEKSELQGLISGYESDLKELKDKEKVLKDSLKLTTENAKKSSNNNEQYTKQISNLETQIQELEQKSIEAKAQIESLTTSASELTALKGQKSVLETEANQCQGQIKADQEELERLKSVEAELISVKNELMLKNAAAELLSAGPSRRQREIRAKANQSVKEQTMDTDTQRKYQEAKQAFEKAQKLLSGSAEPITSSDSGEARVLTVVGSKVNLRNGAGMEHSPVMQISEGSKLTMETQEGEWFRVLTPTGSRAYIHQDEVSFDGVDTTIRTPAKAPIRGGADNSELVPFGKVKVAGNLDTEDLAIQKLKATMK